MPAAKRASSPSKDASPTKKTKKDSPKKASPKKASPQKAEKKVRPHNLNVNGCLDKEVEVVSFKEMLKLNVGALEGVGPKSEPHYKELGIKTIKDMGTYKYWRMAQAIALLAATEEKGERHAKARMNIDGALDKKAESNTLKEVVKGPATAIQGLGPKAEVHLDALHIKTVAQLADNKYFQRAHAIVELAQYEE